jgi:hypothetical protein
VLFGQREIHRSSLGDPTGNGLRGLAPGHGRVAAGRRNSIAVRRRPRRMTLDRHRGPPRGNDPTRRQHRQRRGHCRGRLELQDPACQSLKYAPIPAAVINLLS